MPENPGNRPHRRLTGQTAAGGVPDRVLSGRASEQPAIGAVAKVRIEALKGTDHD